ncbi:hypothetical protein GCM10027514_27330 [Azotobacter armeniacus]
MQQAVAGAGAALRQIGLHRATDISDGRLQKKFSFRLSRFVVSRDKGNRDSLSFAFRNAA